MEEDGLQYIRDYYKVPAVKGRRVIVYGKPGVIVGSSGPHLLVNFDEDKSTLFKPCHPTAEVQYGEMGKIRKLSRSQQRYLEYLHSDCGDKFGEWLKR